jgi:hypothetical protein
VATVGESVWLGAPFFALEEGLLVPRATVMPVFAPLKDQYFFFADRWVESVLLFQVGCF